jgi:hypothetical protein
MKTLPPGLAVIAALAISAVVDAGPWAGGAAAASSPTCIAMVMPTVQGVPGNAPEVAGGVRDLVANYLTGPSVKVVPLEARLPSLAIDEARDKGCESMLYLMLTRKSGSGRLTKALGQAASSSAWYLPSGGTAASAAARTAAAVSLQTASSLASSTKAKDEVRLEYRLQSPGGQVQFGPKTETQTATVDGEDLLTPVAVRVAEAIVTRKGAK